MLHDLDRVLLLDARMYRPDARLDSGAGRGPHARRRVAGTPPAPPPLPLADPHLQDPPSHHYHHSTPSPHLHRTPTPPPTLLPRSLR